MQKDATERVVIILGPTASGKSDLAVHLAERMDGEIVNADSMQVYRRLDIGTAKPSTDLRRRVPHHLIDVVDPDQPFSAANYAERASHAIAEISSRGKRAFVVGGTGLYIKSLLSGLVDSPGGEEALRQELHDRAARFGNEALLQELSQVDPVTAAQLHPNNLVRIIRALEVFRMTGRPISEFRDQHGFSENRYKCLKIGLSVERQELYQRIEGRVDRMMAEGLVEEVRSLLADGFSPGLKSMRAIGYKEVCAHLSGQMTLEDAVSLIKRDTRRYAKRQMTWFTKDLEIKWFDYRENFAKISELANEFFY